MTDTERPRDIDDRRLGRAEAAQDILRRLENLVAGQDRVIHAPAVSFDWRYLSLSSEAMASMPEEMETETVST